jgi:transcriptional regulator with GAF, ATPase, and Fis domain
MDLPPGYRPEFESVMDLLAEMADLRSVDAILERIVESFAARPHMALARIWLSQPPLGCDRCPAAARCARRDGCLRLAASAGSSRVDPEKSWSRLDGGHARIPLGAEHIGRVAATGEPALIPDLAERPRALPEPDWVEREGIRGFSARPLIHRGQLLGAIAVFTRIPIPAAGQRPSWLRIVANQAAASIANARAFQQIERLKRRLEQENAYLQQEVREASSYDRILGESEATRRVRDQIELVAGTDTSVLISGETGTGKELAAREIHRRSRRRRRALIRVNCAAVPVGLWESEFFGHVEGAFTGAVRDRAGRFELADGGTLFLDEVGDIPLEQQSRLLRVLQEGCFERVGEGATREVDVRIVAASNRDLEREIAAGRFRRDLYFRLAVFPIHLPPLRERRADIPLLAEHFNARAASRMGRDPLALGKRDLESLLAYDWPGNARELGNFIERALVLGRLEKPSDRPSPSRPPPGEIDRKPTAGDRSRTETILTRGQIRDLEEQSIRAALRRSGGKIHGPGGAAELLETKPTTLASRIRRMERG